MKNFTRCCVFVLILCVFFMGCYGLPQTSVRMTSAAAISECRFIAVAVLTLKLQYPVLEFSGWSRGVPKIFDQYVGIYYFDINSKSLKRVSNIRPLPGFADQFNVNIGWADRDGLYLTLSGRSKDDQSKVVFRKLLNNGKLISVSEIPVPPPEISEGYRTCTGYLQGKTVSIGPTGGPWKDVLSLGENGELSVNP